MPYFNLMSAINLYVAVDWQGDREIERARGRLQRETRSAEGEKECGGCEGGEREKFEAAANEMRSRKERDSMCVFDKERDRKRIYTSDRYPVVFINRNSI